MHPFKINIFKTMATVTINVAPAINMPPSQVGDLSISLAHGATKVFSAADFTTGLTPAYLDPEGDAPSKVKILTLPLSGILKLNEVPVSVGQEILFSAISSGIFAYQADSGNSAAINTEFTFAMSDVGSQQFTS